MRKVLAFLVWLFSFWTWKDFFLRRLRNPVSHPASGETAEHILSQDGPQESEFARFLSSLPEDERRCHHLRFDRDSKFTISYGAFTFPPSHDSTVQASYLKFLEEFLEAVASSEIEFREEVSIELRGDDSCKRVEAFADALRQSSNRFRKLDLRCHFGFAIRFANCISSVLLRNEAIQHLCLYFGGLKEGMGKDLAAEFMTIIATPHNLQILKSFGMGGLRLDGEGMEQLMKPFQGPPSVLEELRFYSLTSDAQLEHLSGMLASSTSLKTLLVFYNSVVGQEVYTRGYSNIAAALCSNQSLEVLSCEISSSRELKMLLDPLIPKNNNVQNNTTLIELELYESIGGKDGIETLAHMLCTNTSLLKLALINVKDLSKSHDGDDTQEVENVLAILEALKTNKSLKRIDFGGCKAVRGYKVLGAMMDLLLVNHYIEDIDLTRTGLRESGDADYVLSALSKKNKMKLWDTIQSMAIVNPTSGRVFLCGQPFAGMYILMLCLDIPLLILLVNLR